MLTLGIETSSRAGAIALCRDGICLAERPLEQAGRRHAQTLVSELDRLLRDFDVAPGDCDAVAVSIGPGSFTGLRVGVVCAKTFAFATGCRLAAVETFACIADNAPPDVADVWVIGDAQRGDLFVGRYRRSEGEFDREGEIAIVAAEEWCGGRSPVDVVTGPGLERFGAHLAGRCRVLEAALWHPRAAAVALRGERQAAAGRSDDPGGLEPFYLRKSAAEEKRDAV